MAVDRRLEVERKREKLARRQQALEAQIAVLQLQFQTDKEEMERDIASEQAYVEKLDQSRHEMARSRKADSNGTHVSPKIRSQMTTQSHPNNHEVQTDKPKLWQLPLYVAGLTPRSTLAVERIRAICHRYLPGRYELTIIDLYLQPEMAR